jgi:hypothetical protein
MEDCGEAGQGVGLGDAARDCANDFVKHKVEKMKVKKKKESRGSIIWKCCVQKS